jgi:glycosyltransferase involved in cell wall biosynthesis
VHVVIASVDALPHVGGISLMGHHLANALSAHGDVTFVAPKGSYVPRDLVRHYSLLEDVDSEPRKRAGRDGLLQDARIEKLFGRLHAHAAFDRVLLLHPFYYAVGALDACQRLGAATSVYFHGFELRSQLLDGYPREHARLLAERRLGTLKERVFYALGAADEVLVNSRYTASLVRPFGVVPPLRVTGCGVPEVDYVRERDLTPTYDPDEKRNRRATLGLGPAPCATFVGRLVATKGVDQLLRLCVRVPGLQVVIVGTGPDELRLKTMAKELGLVSRVTFRGSVDEHTKWRLLRASDFLALLSRPDDAHGQVEGFGIALLEGACAAAVPLSSGTGGMTDVVQDDVTGLIVRDEADADTVAKTLNDPTTMARLVSSAREMIGARFTWERVADSIVGGW